MSMIRAALYARVSTSGNGQDVRLQLDQLREVAARSGWLAPVEYVDNGVSGAKGREQRPAFDAMLKAVTRRELDLVAAWSVDRLGRSLQDLVATLGELQGAGCDLYLHCQGVDTRTPAGRAMFQMLGVFAEFERALIVERVRAGIARAKRVGTKSGRPHGRPPRDPVRHAREQAELERGLTAGEAPEAIARRLGVDVRRVRAARVASLVVSGDGLGGV